MAKTAYLLKIDPVENHNAFVQMAEISDGRVEIKTGRVGATAFKRYISRRMWTNFYEKKIAEGYVDKTAVYTDMTDSGPQKEKDEFDSIPNSAVREIFRKIVSFAREKIKKEYSVSMKSVTPSMVKDAEDVLNLMEKAANAGDAAKVNKLLGKLFFIIPRQMFDVGARLAPDGAKRDTLLEIVKREREILFLAASEAADEADKKKKSADTKKEEGFLERYGLKVRECTKEESASIKKHLDSHTAPKYTGMALRVVNEKTEKAQKEWMEKNGATDKDVHFLYHGTKNFLLWPIIRMGLVLNPNAPITGKMFGFGIYFANKAAKSLGYTSLIGSRWAKGGDRKAYLFVYKVVYKNPKHVKKWSHEMMSYTKEKIAPYDAVFAHGGVDLKNDEIIVYDEAQATIQYIIELAA